MKRFILSIVTFVLGLASVATFDHAARVDAIEIVPAAESVDECSLIITEDKPFVAFFDSFEEGDYFSGWLIAEEFTGMREVWTILLDNEGDGKVRWRATVLTSNPDGSSNDKDIFESEQIKTERDILTFSTKKIRDVQYHFKGKFLKHRKEFVDEASVLIGTMRKIVKGKEVARFSSNFSYAEPRCFH